MKKKPIVTIQKREIPNLTNLQQLEGFVEKLMKELEYENEEINTLTKRLNVLIMKIVNEERSKMIANIQISPIQISKNTTTEEIIEKLKISGGNVYNTNEDITTIGIIGNSFLIQKVINRINIIVNDSNLNISDLNTLIQFIEQVAINEVLVIAINYDNYEYAYQIKDGQTRRLEKIFV
jgi:hypothetical protein